MTAIADMTILALNDAESSENRIHSDAIAAKYGFTGALVSGVNVFGYLSQPLIRELGANCLERAEYDVKFRSPAYHNDPLLIKTATGDSDARKQQFSSSAYNQRGELLAELETILWRDMPEAMKSYPACRDAPALERSEIHWDMIQLLEAAPDFLWTPSEEDNQQRVAAQRDRSTIYQGPTAYIHPYYLLDACNKALMRIFVLPAWIHTGSRLVIRKPIRCGQEIVVRAVPTDKWERKGHQFLSLNIAMMVEEELALQAEHTAIFRIAE